MTGLTIWLRTGLYLLRVTATTCKRDLWKFTPTSTDRKFPAVGPDTANKICRRRTFKTILIHSHGEFFWLLWKQARIHSTAPADTNGQLGRLPLQTHVFRLNVSHLVYVDKSPRDSMPNCLRSLLCTAVTGSFFARWGTRQFLRYRVAIFTTSAI